LPVTIRELLTARYGTRAGIVARIAAERGDLAAPLAAGAPAIGAEVVFAIGYALARTVSDFLIRRTAMAWRAPHEACAAAPAVARLMAVELGWTPGREAFERAGFESTGAFNAQ
jgi:glycerol-3-phosphate dehydrogenase